MASVANVTGNLLSHLLQSKAKSTNHSHSLTTTADSPILAASSTETSLDPAVITQLSQVGLTLKDSRTGPRYEAPDGTTIKPISLDTLKDVWNSTNHEQPTTIPQILETLQELRSTDNCFALNETDFLKCNQELFTDISSLAQGYLTQNPVDKYAAADRRELVLLCLTSIVGYKLDEEQETQLGVLLNRFLDTSSSNFDSKLGELFEKNRIASAGRDFVSSNIENYRRCSFINTIKAICDNDPDLIARIIGKKPSLLRPLLIAPLLVSLAAGSYFTLEANTNKPATPNQAKSVAKNPNQPSTGELLAKPLEPKTPQFEQLIAKEKARNITFKNKFKHPSGKTILIDSVLVDFLNNNKCIQFSVVKNMYQAASQENTALGNLLRFLMSYGKEISSNFNPDEIYFSFGDISQDPQFINNTGLFTSVMAIEKSACVRLNLPPANLEYIFTRGTASEATVGRLTTGLESVTDNPEQLAQNIFNGSKLSPASASNLQAKNTN